MKVLVTGGSGFLGSHLITYLLNQGIEVRAIEHITPIQTPAHSGLEIVRGDLRVHACLLDITCGIDAVFHTAAKPGIWGSWSDYFSTNALITRYLLDAAQQNKVKYFIYTSTASVVFRNQSLRGITEQVPYGKRWLCHYAHTKAIAEQEVLAASGHSSMATIALRPHLMWGPGDRHLVPRLLQKARLNEVYKIGEGSNFADILYIDNAVHAHWLALQALIKGKGVGKPYFIAQEKPVNLWSWIQDLLHMHHVSPIQKSLSFKSAYALGYIFEMAYKLVQAQKEPSLTRFLALQLAKDFYFSTQAAREDLGYSPLISTPEAMETLANSKRPIMAAK
jgi:nucleoside-diphosphate-sugar epimerase